MESIATHTKLKAFLSIPHISAGFIAVLVGYTSSVVIIFQAATAAGASAAETSSWLWALGIGMSLSCIGLSLHFKVPVLTAWSTPGAALLATSLSGISLNEAIGVFIFTSTLVMACGLSGWFEKIMNRVPMPLAGAMLAGILLQFGLNLFGALESEFLLAGTMLIMYIICKQTTPRFAIPIVLLVGVAVAVLQNELHFESVSWEISMPIWTSPNFTIASLVGVGIPLFVVTMSSQNIPGVVAIRANGYNPPISPLISWTGFTGIVLAPFGGIGFNLAAITASICLSKDAGHDPDTRYFASVWAGVFYLLTGLFGATIVSVFYAFPSALVVAIAGIALLNTIGNSLYTSLAQESAREAALLTFLVTASGVSLLGVSSAFWGLIVGLPVYYIQRKIKD